MNKLREEGMFSDVEPVQDIDWMGSYDVRDNAIDLINSRKSDPAPTTTNNNVQESYVHEPTHYQIFPDMQVIDVIRKSLTEEEFKGFCKGNILKYRLRDKQDREEDYEKSRKYQMYLQNIENI